MRKVLTISMILMLVACMPLAMAVVAEWDGQLVWNGQGADSLRCDKLGESPERTEAGWIHWIITGASEVTDAELVVNGDQYTEYEINGGALSIFTPYYEVEGLSATFNYNGTLGNTQFVISDYCPGKNGEIPEFPTIALPIAAILGLAFFFQRRKE
ncbi:PEF-CTERM sorting domain-containing protein [Methanolobus psychrotolerans]|uniref:PEF-CTERM sorting domain-containing protein n=1 Tax=Methanolobus psychrotolerans TaxID=1874706 RepID=UPI001F5D6245|nr:PEF-CTERM sorting domain-containing protein [Methanolobus psychrotolerans]